MKLTILGSAAAEGWPGLFCDCAPCREARRRGGPDLRRRTAYAVNNDTLVDFGPDIHGQALAFGLDLARIRHIFVTHSHEDHLSPVELGWRRDGFSAVTADLTLYGNDAVQARLERELPVPFEQLRMRMELIAPGQTVTAGTLRVTALEADHTAPAQTALNYVIAERDRAILIANDTGWWPDHTWDAVRQFTLDVAILECTYLHKHPDRKHHHLGADATVAMRDHLAELGVLRRGCRCIANHFSHNGMTLHRELCDAFAAHDMEVGFDGMQISV